MADNYSITSVSKSISYFFNLLFLIKKSDFRLVDCRVKINNFQILFQADIFESREFS